MRYKLKTATTQKQLRDSIDLWSQEDATMALVPTMGALHEGHITLVELAKKRAAKTIVSIFVNPKQFGAGEDLDQYPREEARDLEKLVKAGVDLVYIPDLREIYPPGFATTICVRGPSKGLCSHSRPHFFDGVATVVTKLLLHCRPDMAIFGEKDYQQLLVVRRLVIDLDLPVEIVGAPIVRENDGLALSSRNAYLNSSERATAPLLQKALLETRTGLQNGASMREAALKSTNRLTKAGFILDYFELCDAQTLEPLAHFDHKPARLLIAATLGRTRLIDNIAVMG